MDESYKWGTDVKSSDMSSQKKKSTDSKVTNTKVKKVKKATKSYKDFLKKK